MKNIVYVGGFASGTIFDVRTRETHPFKNGEPVIVSDELADELTTQQPENWKESE